MKTKTKLLTLLEIVIVLCSLFLVALPTIAAEQTAQTITASSENDFVLGVYGNANEDDTIDMRDLTYVKLIFFGKKPETELADAKYDGKINPLDFIQIKLIIVGKEKELTLIDSHERVKTFNMPVKRIIALDDGQAEPVRVLGAEDMVVGVGSGVKDYDTILPKMSKLPTVGSMRNIDYEKVLSLKPDLFLVTSTWSLEVLEEKLEPYGVQAFRLLGSIPLQTIISDTRKLGYLLGKVDKAEKFTDFHSGYLDKIKSRTEGLSEDEKPRVYVEAWRNYMTCSDGSKQDELITLAGGVNIAHDISGSGEFPILPTVDPEWVVEQNPDIIIYCARGGGDSYGGGAEITAEMKAAREEIQNRPELTNVNAVKNGDVYIVSNDIAWSGMQGFVEVGYCAKWFHPHLFKDLDPEAIHQEYMEGFIRVDYDVKNGVFVYPPLED